MVRRGDDAGILYNRFGFPVDQVTWACFDAPLGHEFYLAEQGYLGATIYTAHSEVPEGLRNRVVSLSLTKEVRKSTARASVEAQLILAEPKRAPGRP